MYEQKYCGFCSALQRTNTKKKLFRTKNKQIDPSFDHATHVEPSCILGQSICCGFHFIQKWKKISEICKTEIEIIQISDMTTATKTKYTHQNTEVYFDTLSCHLSFIIFSVTVQQNNLVQCDRLGVYIVHILSTDVFLTYTEHKKRSAEKNRTKIELYEFCSFAIRYFKNIRWL